MIPDALILESPDRRCPPDFRAQIHRCLGWRQPDDLARGNQFADFFSADPSFVDQPACQLLEFGPIFSQDRLGSLERRPETEIDGSPEPGIT